MPQADTYIGNLTAFYLYSEQKKKIIQLPHLIEDRYSTLCKEPLRELHNMEIHLQVHNDQLSALLMT